MTLRICEKTTESTIDLSKQEMVWDHALQADRLLFYRKHGRLEEAARGWVPTQLLANGT